MRDARVDGQPWLRLVGLLLLMLKDSCCCNQRHFTHPCHLCVSFPVPTQHPRQLEARQHSAVSWPGAGADLAHPQVAGDVLRHGEDPGPPVDAPARGCGGHHPAGAGGHHGRHPGRPGVPPLPQARAHHPAVRRGKVGVVVGSRSSALCFPLIPPPPQLISVCCP